MSIFKIIYALSTAVLVVGSIEAAPPVVANAPVQTTFTLNSVAAPLSAEQSHFLHLYMNYLFVPPMDKLPRNIKDILPFYIAMHSNELDPGSLRRFNISQQLSAGMSFEEIAALHSVMTNLRNGRLLTPEEDLFLKDFIQVDVKAKPSLTLDPEVAPLFFYVSHNPDKFNAKMVENLRAALFKSVGLTAADVAKLKALADNKELSPPLSVGDVNALNKLINLARIQKLDVFDPNKLLRLQYIILNNPSKFSSQDEYDLGVGIENTPSIQKLREDTYRKRALETEAMNRSNNRFDYSAPGGADVRHQQSAGR